MARIFTISFRLWDEHHSALITVRSEQTDQVEYAVKFFDEDLNYIVPEGLKFTSSDTQLPLSIRNQTNAAEELFLSLKHAVSAYLTIKK